MKLTFFILLLVVCLTSCEEIISIDLPTDDNLVIVEGFITNELRTQEVRLSRSQGFNEPSEDTTIPGASVSVFDLSGNVFTFQFDSGVYKSDSLFAGEVGRRYGLVVVLPEGDTITSPFVTMPEVVPIDLLLFNSFPEESPDDPSVILQIYFPVVWASDPGNRRNFYRYVFARNDSLFNTPQDIELLADDAINGNTFPNEFRTFRYDFGDRMTCELRSINKGAFDFLRLLKNQTTSLGTASGTSPAGIDSNLTNDTNPSQVVLGYFGCYSLSRASIVLEP
ncbi:MAG: DUF4249 domain-containing protein [Bacteroidota bacterium]